MHWRAFAFMLRLVCGLRQVWVVYERSLFMTRSIFDPGGDETERSGSTFLGPEAQQGSQMPPDVIDGKVDAEEGQEAAEAQDDTTAVPPYDAIRDGRSDQPSASA
jgi:hypothetical protein